LASESLAELSTRIERILGEHAPTAGWWVELVATLDAVSARLSQASADAAGRLALAEQIRLDAPHLFRSVLGLDDESDALSLDLVRVRIAAGDAAGDAARAPAICAQVRVLLGRLRRLEHRANALMFDAYDRDIGGE
jgi:hypothetical protein